MPRARRKSATGGLDGDAGLIAYYRVSTQQQGRSGLGLDAQKEAVARYIAGDPKRRLIGEYEEVESGRKDDRPQLRAALAACRAQRAVLVIAKLDRLSRDVRFLLSIVDGAGEGGLVFCDLPQFPPGPIGKLILTIMASIAEFEAGLISQRTKAALAAAKARGRKLGGSRVVNRCPETIAAATATRSRFADEHVADVLPYIVAARGAGATSLRQIAAALTARGIRTPFDNAEWTPTQVKRVLDRSEKRPI